MFTIIYDNKEKRPWNFTNHEMSKAHLKTGDYTIEGLENLLCIERKRSVSEVAKNITESRFKDWVGRMSSFKYSYLILEFGRLDVMKYPYNDDVPVSVRKKIRIRGKFIMSKLYEVEEQDITLIFAENRLNAQDIALNIMEKTYEQYK
tara:strand:- start:79 stop:522 length:444 start_codon:yes stop_codon:yes gene_type:complete